MIKTGKVYWNPDKILKVCQHPENPNRCYVHLKDNELVDEAPCSAEDFSIAWNKWKRGINEPMYAPSDLSQALELMRKAVGGGTPEENAVDSETIKIFCNYWELLHEALDGLMHKHQNIDYDTLVEQIRAVYKVRHDFGNLG